MAARLHARLVSLRSICPSGCPSSPANTYGVPRNSREMHSGAVENGLKCTTPWLSRRNTKRQNSARSLTVGRVKESTGVIAGACLSGRFANSAKGTCGAGSCTSPRPTRPPYDGYVGHLPFSPSFAHSADAGRDAEPPNAFPRTIASAMAARNAYAAFGSAWFWAKDLRNVFIVSGALNWIPARRYTRAA